MEAVKVALRTRTLRVAPLTGAHLEDYEAELNTLLAPKPEQTLKDTLEALYKLVAAACEGTESGLTRDVLRKEIDLRNRKALVEALLGAASGFEPVVPGEAPRP